MTDLNFLEGETVEEFIYRVGYMKENNEINMTWQDISDIITKHAGGIRIKSSDSCRKMYYKIKNALEASNSTTEIENEEHESASNEEVVSIITEDEIAKDERAAINRIKKEIARKNDFHNKIIDAIKAYDPVDIPKVENKYKETCVYAMLSDVHYGMAFNNSIGIYDPEIARERIMRYAAEIKKQGKHHNARACYVSLMGDLISGMIHNTIRIENRENVTQQIAQMGAIVGKFLMEISSSFEDVFVNNVPGNHGRFTQNQEDSCCEDNGDIIVYFIASVYCRNQPNIHFEKNEIAPNVGCFVILENVYCSIHGDTSYTMDELSCRLEKLLKRPVDYLLGAHMHVPMFILGQHPFIRNGCLCGSGDEYTIKKNLYGSPSQTLMIVSKTGVDAIYPIVFSNNLRKSGNTLELN